MAVITKITTQQKKCGRYNIFTDDGHGEKFAFSVDEDVLIKYKLKKGMELDEFSVLEIHYQDDIRKAYNLAVSYLARRMRSEQEIRAYLKKKEVEEPVIQEVIHKLTAQKYIDDQEFANAYVRTQVSTTDKGPELILIELKEKGIGKNAADIAMEAFTLEHQLEKAVKLAKKYIGKNSRDSHRVMKQKLESLLIRKGYPFDIIHRAISELDVQEASDEFEAIRYQWEKLHRKYSRLEGAEYDRKMKQALYRKGFSFETIERFLAEENNEC